MSDIEPFPPQGMLHQGWTAEVNDYVISCGWALNGKIFLSADTSGGLYAFDGINGNIIWKKENIHSSGILAMSISPLGNIIATSGQDGCVILWDSDFGRKIETIDIGRGWVEHLSWSSDGTSLAVALSRNVYVYTSKGKKIWSSEKHPSTVSAIAWSRNDELATACYGKVSFFDVISSKTNQVLEWKGSLISMVLSPNGDIVACGSQDNSVHFWRRSTGHDAEMTGYPGKPNHLSFDDTGTLLATGGSERVTVWSFQGEGPEGTMPGELEHHTKPVSSLSFSNKGMLIASGSRDGSVVVSFLKNNGDGDPVGAAFAGKNVSALAWKPGDSAIAAVNADGKVFVWNFKVRLDSDSKGFG